MSSDDHGHGHGGHDDGPSDIIAVGSWQDKFLALVALSALVGIGYWAGGYVQGIKVPVAQHGAAHAEHASGGHAVGNGAVPEHGDHEATTGGDEFHNGSAPGSTATEGGAPAESSAEHGSESQSTEANPNVEGAKAADPPAGDSAAETAGKNGEGETHDAAPSH